MSEFKSGGVSGFCPYCGSENIEYLCGEIADYGYDYDCKCNSCGENFKESYDLVFVGCIVNSQKNDKKK